MRTRRTRAALEGVEFLRGGVDRPEQRELLAATTEELFEEAFTFYGTVYRYVPDGRFEEHAFMTSERSRARSFMELMSADRIARAVRGHPLARRRQLVTQALLRLSRDDPGQAQPLLSELRAIREQIARDAPAIAALTEGHVAGLEEICANISEDGALVEYFISSRGDKMSVFVLTREGIRLWDELDLSSFDLPDSISTFLVETGARRQQPGRSSTTAARDAGLKTLPEMVDQPYAPTGQLLFDGLMSSVWEELDPQIRRLVIVPHRELHMLPFAALWTTEAGEPNRLSDRFDVTVLPSSSYLPLCVGLPRPTFQPGHAVVLGDPTGDLPGAANEATAVAELLGVVPILGTAATRATLLNLPPGTAVVHVASHGAFDDRDPLISGVEMSDRRVTVDDLMENADPVGLLVLSGCVTGVASRRPGDELAGLGRAAATAGIPSVLCTLWNIDDQSASVFFRAFYAALIEGESKDRAITRA